jgi:hypothetical protein
LIVYRLTAEIINQSEDETMVEVMFFREDEFKALGVAIKQYLNRNCLVQIERTELHNEIN